jgi:hypothetical protein
LQQPKLEVDHQRQLNQLPPLQHQDGNSVAGIGSTAGGIGGGHGNMVDGIMSSAFGFSQDSLSRMTSMTNQLSLPNSQAAAGMIKQSGQELR